VAFLLLLTAFLTAYNNATNLLRLPDIWYVPMNLAVGALLVLAAHRHGLSLAQQGFSSEGVGPGVRWGLAVAGVVAVGLGVALLLPAAQPMLGDQRVAHLTPRALLFTVALRIPLGTALFEEVAFRGVLLAAWERHTSLVAAVVVSSVVFGLWHIGPTIVALQRNGVAMGAGGWAAVAGSVVVTTVAGVVFCLLRVHTGGIVAPVIVHTATNSLGTLAAYVAQRRLTDR
jgi:uncharacterized protein